MFTPPPTANSCILGDCGLLAKLVFPNNIAKKFKIGIVPHFTDIDNLSIKRLSQKFQGSVTIISPLGNPRTVIKKIKECRHIISSSLHGLIIADAFGIPTRRWVDRKTMPDIEFHDYKFEDYYSAIDFHENPIILTGDETIEWLIASTSLKPQNKIIRLISDLDTAMKDIAKQFKQQI